MEEIRTKLYQVTPAGNIAYPGDTPAKQTTQGCQHCVPLLVGDVFHMETEPNVLGEFKHDGQSGILSGSKFCQPTQFALLGKYADETGVVFVAIGGTAHLAPVLVGRAVGAVLFTLALL